MTFQIGDRVRVNYDTFSLSRNKLKEGDVHEYRIIKAGTIVMINDITISRPLLYSVMEDGIYESSWLDPDVSLRVLSTLELLALESNQDE